MVQYDEKTALYNPYPGPMGGDYSISYWYDKNEKPCERKDAYTVLEVEYDKNDEIVGSQVFALHPLND